MRFLKHNGFTRSLRCGVICNDDFVANFVLSLAVKGFWKLLKALIFCEIIDTSRVSCFFDSHCMVAALTTRKCPCWVNHRPMQCIIFKLQLIRCTSQINIYNLYQNHKFTKHSGTRRGRLLCDIVSVSGYRNNVASVLRGKVWFLFLVLFLDFFS